VVREVGLFRADLQVYCTSLGPAEAYPPPALRDRYPAQGVFVALFQTELMGEPSVVVHRRMADGAGANVLVAPMEFRNDVLQEALGVRGGFRMTLEDGTVVGETPGMVTADTPGYLFASAVSPRHPVRIEASRPVADERDAFVERVPSFGLVGLVLGGLAAAAFARAMRRRLSLEAELRIALRRGELEVHYQPVVELATGRCAGAEALVRWRHPQRGLVHPALFIAMAEETGLVMPMTDWMLRRVRDDVLQWFRDRPGYHVGVNLVAQHFADEAIVEEVRKVLNGSGLQPSVLMLEATERQLIEGGDTGARRVMEALRALGCTLAIDDFGTGQSSLAYLQRFPMDYLKIDKAFVDTIGTDALSRPVLDAVIDLGHRLGLRLIAEGVEQVHQAEYLRQRGVHLAQGFLYSAPLPAAELAAFVSDCNGGGEWGHSGFPTHAEASPGAATRVPGKAEG
jgi:sensor c-di-GMP phosphodiesterase-like protein